MDNPKRQRCVGSVNTRRKKYWTGRVEILHVEAHTDTKRDREGKKTESNTTRENESTCRHASGLPVRSTSSGTRNEPTTNEKNCGQILKNNRVLSGNWRKQILEEIRIETSKKMATTNKTFWGQCQEEIEWARMRKTRG